MIIISSDSTSDLNELFKTRNIPTLPLAVILGDKSYEDGITVTPDDIYAFVKENGILPKTAARSVAEHKEFFSSIRKKQGRQHHPLYDLGRNFRHRPKRFRGSQSL